MPPFAEKLSYWKTSRSGADTWIERACDEITKINGRVIRSAIGEENGTTVFMIEFIIKNDTFFATWKSLEPQVKNQVNLRAAKVQAATALYHHIKDTCIAAAWMGDYRSAFLPWLKSPEGMTVGQMIPTIMEGRLLPARVQEGEVMP